MPQPSFLANDVFKRVQDLRFQQRMADDIHKLSFPQTVQDGIDQITQLGQSFMQPTPKPDVEFLDQPEPLPIVVSDRPEIGMPSPQVQTPVPMSVPAQADVEESGRVPAQQQAAAASPTTIEGMGGGAPRPQQQLRPMSGQYGEIDNSSRQSFVRTAWPYMLEAAGGNQDAAEMMLAAAISENGSIGSGKPIWAHSYFGIKGKGTAGSARAATHEIINGQRVDIDDDFAAYNTPQEGMRGFFDFLENNSRYHPALARYRQTGNASQLFRDVNAAGYATDAGWAGKVENIRNNQVAPLVRGQRQSSAAPQPEQQPSAGLPPRVAQQFKTVTGMDASPEDIEQLRGLGLA